MNNDLTFNARTHENVDYVKGHTTLAMTLHYLRDITPDNETMNQMCNILG